MRHSVASWLHLAAETRIEIVVTFLQAIDAMKPPVLRMASRARRGEAEETERVARGQGFRVVGLAGEHHGWVC